MQYIYCRILIKDRDGRIFYFKVYLEITLVFPLVTSFTFASMPRSQGHCITIGQDGCSFLVIKKKIK